MTQDRRFFGRAWASLSSTRNVFGKLCLIALLQFVPVVGQMITLGYFLGWVREAAWGLETPMGAHVCGRGDDQFWPRGALAWCAGVLYGALAFVVDAAILAVMVWGMAGLDVLGQSVLLGVGSAVLVVATVLLTICYYVGLVRLAIYGRFGAAWQWGKSLKMASRDFGGLLKVAFGTVGLNLLVTVLMALVCAAGFALCLAGGGSLAGVLAMLGEIDAADDAFMLLASAGLIAVPLSYAATFVLGIPYLLVSAVSWRALGNWAAGFDVPRWGGPSAPLPFEHAEGDGAAGSVPASPAPASAAAPACGAGVTPPAAGAALCCASGAVSTSVQGVTSSPAPVAAAAPGAGAPAAPDADGAPATGLSSPMGAAAPQTGAPVPFGPEATATSGLLAPTGEPAFAAPSEPALCLPAPTGEPVAGTTPAASSGPAAAAAPQGAPAPQPASPAPQPAAPARRSSPALIIVLSLALVLLLSVVGAVAASFVWGTLHASHYATGGYATFVPASEPKDVVGTWSVEDGSTLVLRTDRTFELTYADGAEVFGTYIVSAYEDGADAYRVSMNAATGTDASGDDVSAQVRGNALALRFEIEQGWDGADDAVIYDLNGAPGEVRATRV